jgi:hypothetical protein
VFESAINAAHQRAVQEASSLREEASQGVRRASSTNGEAPAAQAAQGAKVCPCTEVLQPLPGSLGKLRLVASVLHGKLIAQMHTRTRTHAHSG